MTSTRTTGDDLSVHDTDTRAPWVPAQAEPVDDYEAALDIVPTPKVPLPLLRRRSGVYTRTRLIPIWPLLPRPFAADGELAALDGDNEFTPNPEGPIPGPGVPAPGDLPQLPSLPKVPLPLPQLPRYRLATEELRVDVDGRAPTMTVSGVIPGGFLTRPLTWIARVARTPTGTYVGNIGYRDGSSSLLPQTRVEVTLHPVLPIGPLSATATFSGGGAPTVSRDFTFARGWFREVNVEFDIATDATAVTAYDTASHPNRPATLPLERLTIESTYGHMGIKVTRSLGDSVVDNKGAGGNNQWSDIEMHDAMRVNWARFKDVPQWAMWVFFARQHELGSSLGGIMFDQFGIAERQGCAIFSDSFISQAPAGDPAPGAWVERMRFWTAVHEMGHSFNLAHSWDKAQPVSWVPLVAEPEARSYMNYPYRVAPAAGKTREQTFFSNFQFRFSDPELLFLRHAPERFVEMGAAPWFDHHAFEQARAEAITPLQLEVRLHRPAMFEFLEPVIVELKLTNVSGAPMVLDSHVLDSDDLVLFVTREGGEAHAVRPYARRCFEPDPVALPHGEALYAQATVSFDAYGHAVADPGRYRVHAMLRADDADVLAAPLDIRVLTPASRDEEMAAGDVLTPEVGAVLAVGGTRALDKVTDVLQDVAERLSGTRLAVHADAALGAAAARDGIVLGERSDDGAIDVTVRRADAEEASRRLGAAFGDLNVAAQTFGHIGVTDKVMRDAAALKAAGNRGQAGALANDLVDTLEQRGVKESVVADCRKEATRLAK